MTTQRVWRAASVVLLSVLFLGCVSGTQKDYNLFRAEDPQSILIVPVINRTVEIDAPDYFLTTVARPIAERGYYVFPIHLTKRILEDDGLADANLVHAADPTRLGEIFGADAIMYITIEHWKARYLVFSTRVDVEFTYILRSGRTGEELWRESSALMYSSSQSSSGFAILDLIVNVASAAATKAAPNYIPLARQANFQAVAFRRTGLPAGPYREEYGLDLEHFPVLMGEEAQVAAKELAASKATREAKLESSDAVKVASAPEAPAGDADAIRAATIAQAVTAAEVAATELDNGAEAPLVADQPSTAEIAAAEASSAEVRAATRAQALAAAEQAVAELDSPPETSEAAVSTVAAEIEVAEVAAAPLVTTQVRAATVAAAIAAADEAAIELESPVDTRASAAVETSATEAAAAEVRAATIAQALASAEAAAEVLADAPPAEEASVVTVAKSVEPEPISSLIETAAPRPARVAARTPGSYSYLSLSYAKESEGRYPIDIRIEELGVVKRLSHGEKGVQELRSGELTLVITDPLDGRNQHPNWNPYTLKIDLLPLSYTKIEIRAQLWSSGAIEVVATQDDEVLLRKLVAEKQ